MVGGNEGYQPSEDEISDAESHMADREKIMSEAREETREFAKTGKSTITEAAERQKQAEIKAVSDLKVYFEVGEDSESKREWSAGQMKAEIIAAKDKVDRIVVMNHHRFDDEGDDLVSLSFQAKLKDGSIKSLGRMSDHERTQLFVDPRFKN